jgi:hypothetical protein
VTRLKKKTAKIITYNKAALTSNAIWAESPSGGAQSEPHEKFEAHVRAAPELDLR